MLKRILSIVLVSVMLIGTLGMSAVALAGNETDGGMGVVNPIKEYDTFAELQKAVDFTITPPPLISKGYKLYSYSTIGGDLAQITYKDEQENTILYRAMSTPKAQDISGSYVVYKKEKTLTYDDCTVTVKGSLSGAKLATWYKDDISYSFMLDTGATWSSMQRMLDAMLKPEQ